jgi:FOG: WD40 repeat
LVEQQIVQRVCLNPRTPHQINDTLQADIVCSVPDCGYLIAGATIRHWQIMYLMQHLETVDLYLAAAKRTAATSYPKMLVRVLRNIDTRALPQLQKIFMFQHPYIHPLTNIDWVHPNQSLAMLEPFEERGSLARYIQAGQPLASQQVIALVRQIAEALQYAHGQHVIHGRLKPENCLLTAPTTVQVTDFYHSTHIVETVSVNNAYLAPEQLHGRSEPASDQYALATIAYQLFSGHHPFSHTLSQGGAHTITPLSSLRSDLPPAIDVVFQRALHAQAEQRYPTIQAFALALQGAVSRTTAPNQAVGTQPDNSTNINQLGGSNPRLAPNYPQMSPARNPFTPGNSNPHLTPNYPQMSPVRNPFTPEGSNPHLSNTSMPGLSPSMSAPTPPPSSETVPQNASLLYRLTGHTAPINQLRWAPNGQFIASIAEHTIRFWRIKQQTGTPLTTVLEQNGQMLALHWSQDNVLLATTTSSGTIRIWDVPPEMSRIPTSKLAWWGHEGRIPALDWSHNGAYLLTGGADRTLRLWDTAGQPLTAWRAHGRGGVTTAQWSPDDRYIVSGGVDRQLQVWDAQQKTTIFTCTAHNDEIRHVAWSPDGTVIASSGGKKDQRIMLWNSTTGQCVTELQECQQEITGIFWGPASNWLGATTTDNLLHIWSFWPAKKVQTIQLSATPLAVDYHATQHKVAIGMKDTSIHILQLF